MILLFWLSYAFRSLKRSGTRGVFAFVCVAVGVAGVVALQTATLTIQNALTSNVRAANGGDISLTTDESPLSPTDLAIFKQLQASGHVTRWTARYTVHATAVGSGQRLIPFDVNVVTAPPYPLGGQPSFVSPSHGNVATLLHRSGDVLLTSVLADELGVGVGSRMLVNSIGGSGLHVIVRGVVSETSLNHAAIMMVNSVDGPALSSGAPRYTSVFLDAPTGSVQSDAQTLRNQFPAASVQTVQDALTSARQQVHDFQQFMLLVGLLALLIAGIGILNAMQSMLAQRRNEIAMLKAMGFGRGTLYSLFGTEAILIGLMGGIGGTLTGALASKFVAEALARAVAIQVTFVLDSGTLASGIGLGIGATLIFAVLPIVRMAAIRPLEILREGSGQPVTGWMRTTGLVVLTILLFAALASVTLSDTVLAAQFVIAAIVVFVLLTGVFAGAVAGVARLGRPISRLAGIFILVVLLLLSVLSVIKVPSIAAILVLGTVIWALTVFLPTERLLALLIAARSLSRRRIRTSVTLVAFLAGVLCMTVVLTVALSLQQQIQAALASTETTNLRAITSPSSEPKVVAATRSLLGVKSRSVTTVLQTTPIAINGHSLPVFAAPPGGDSGEFDWGRFLDGVTGWNLARGDHPTNIRLVDGRLLGPQDAGTANVLLRSALESSPYGLTLGDTVTLQDSGNGKVAVVKVVGFYARGRFDRAFGSQFTPPVYADRGMAVGLGGADAQSIINLTVDPNQLAHDATSLQRQAPGSLVVNVGDLVAVVERILNELLNLLIVITALVLGAAVAVVANGVGLAMLERRREIALFKAIGFGPSRVLQFVLVENALLGTLAGTVSILVAAIGLGLLSHYAFQQAVGFDPVVAALVLVLAIVLSIMTAYVTSRRPLRIRPIEALRNE